MTRRTKSWIRQSSFPICIDRSIHKLSHCPCHRHLHPTQRCLRSWYQWAQTRCQQGRQVLQQISVNPVDGDFQSHTCFTDIPSLLELQRYVAKDEDEETLRGSASQSPDACVNQIAPIPNTAMTTLKLLRSRIGCNIVPSQPADTPRYPGTQKGQRVIKSHQRAGSETIELGVVGIEGVVLFPRARGARIKVVI